MRNTKLITKEKKCSKCGSKNIEPCWVGSSDIIATQERGELPKVNKWQYICLDCKTRFHVII